MKATEKHPLITWFALNPVVANLLMVGILVMGVWSAIKIRKEAFPSFAAESIQVQIPFRGGTPEDVERGVSIKVEEALEGVEGIEHIKSTSTENAALITVEAEEGYNLVKLLDDVKIKVDAIPSFPEQIEKPIIEEQKKSSPVMWVEVYGDVSEADLKETARELKDRLLRLPNVSKITTHGAREYEMSIEVSEEQLRLLGLTFDQVASAVSGQSIDLSGGVIRSDRGEITLRSRSQRYTASDFAKIPLRSPKGGGQILLGDIASIRDGFVDQEMLGRFDGEATVSLEVKNEGLDDIIRGSKETAGLIETFLAEGHAPQGVSVTYWNDQSASISSRLTLLGRNGLMGIGLVLISLSLFLNVRLALWVALGIPISLAGAMILLPWFGISLNELSSFAFIVVLGIVVDDAIVVGESIYLEKQAGAKGLEGTIRGVSRVVVPATFGVLTTIATFLPLTQVTGRMGQVFGQIGSVVIFCLIFSLIESKLILPAHLAHLDVNRRSGFFVFRIWSRLQKLISDGLNLWISKVYQPILRILTPLRYLVAAAFLAGLIVVGSMVPGGQIRSVFFPDIELDSISATVEMEEGIPVSTLHDVVRQIELGIRELAANTEDETGERFLKHTQIQASSNTRGSIVAELSSGETRRISTSDITKQWREIVGPIAGAKSLTFSGNAGPPGEAFVVQLSSNDLDTLRKAAEAMKAKLVTIPGLNDVQDSFNTGRPEIEIKLTDLGQANGFDQLSLAREVRNAFFGAEAQRMQRGRDEVRVMVRYPQEDRESINQLRNMRVRNPQGDALPFDLVADIEYSTGLAQIQRNDGLRVVRVKAEIDKAVTSSEESVQYVQANFIPEFEIEFPLVDASFTGEAEQRAKSLGSLRQGFLLSLLMIYVLLAIPLKSYFKPIFIMIVIPYGIIGALLGHWIVGIPVSILSMFGILALSGVVVNDSLVFLCEVDRLRAEEDLSLRDAVHKGAGNRFRPIMLTSVTTFVGLAPLLFETAMQAQFLIPMAVSLAFGVLFATFITLLLLPMLYLIGGDISTIIRTELTWFREGFRGKAGAKPEDIM